MDFKHLQWHAVAVAFPIGGHARPFALCEPSSPRTLAHTLYCCRLRLPQAEAHWYEQVKCNSRAIRETPEEIRSNAEIVRAAVRKEYHEGLNDSPDEMLCLLDRSLMAQLHASLPMMAPGSSLF